MKFKYKNKVFIVITNNSVLKFSFTNGLNIRFEYRKFYKGKVWHHWRIILFENLTNKEARRQRDNRFAHRKAIVRIRPKLRILDISNWETNNNSRKKTLHLKTKSYIRIEACAPGKIEVPARSWN